MKKYLKYMLAVLYVTVILLCVWRLGKYFEKQQQTMSELRRQQEELQRKYAETGKQYVECNHTNGNLHEQIMSTLQENKELEERLSRWEKTKTDGSGFFYGHWTIDILYSAAHSEEKEYCKDIMFQSDYIYLSGSYVVNDPVYSVTMRWGDDIWKEMAQMGFTYREVMDTGLFNYDYYVEMELEGIENWNREIKENEEDFMQRAKYYLLNQNTMICMTQNDGGKVYILCRD